MKNLNTYINEAWSGVKQQSIKADIEAWCDEMNIRNYTINFKGEIDVNGGVDLSFRDFKELPYKFGIVTGHFSLVCVKKLKSLKNCPDEISGYFDVDNCSALESLEGCPKEVDGNFYCRKCKRKFTKEEAKSLCKVKKENIFV